MRRGLPNSLTNKNSSQTTVMGILTAFCFLFISRSEPLPELSAKKPLPNLFSIYMFFAVIGQFAIHLASIMYLVNQSEAYLTGTKPQPDSEFAPNVMNTAIFLIMNSIQVTTFAVNHHGHPFMDSITENLPLFGVYKHSFRQVLTQMKDLWRRLLL